MPNTRTRTQERRREIDQGSKVSIKRFGSYLNIPIKRQRVGVDKRHVIGSRMRHHKRQDFVSGPLRRFFFCALHVEFRRRGGRGPLLGRGKIGNTSFYSSSISCHWMKIDERSSCGWFRWVSRCQ